MLVKSDDDDDLVVTSDDDDDLVVTSDDDDDLVVTSDDEDDEDDDDLAHWPLTMDMCVQVLL